MGTLLVAPFRVLTALIMNLQGCGAHTEAPEAVECRGHLGLGCRV